MLHVGPAVDRQEQRLRMGGRRSMAVVVGGGKPFELVANCSARRTQTFTIPSFSTSA
jgi:hypothetical protein